MGRRETNRIADHSPNAVALILRELFGGKIRLVPQLDGGLMAHWNLHPGALLKSLGTYGSGGRYELYSNYPLKIQAVTDSLAT
jgi:hypothetical protein